jgi:hypothetical protein
LKDTKADGMSEITKVTTDLIDTSGVDAVRIQVCNSQNTCTWSDWVRNPIRTS